MIANIASAAPAAIDAVLAEINAERAALEARLAVLDRDAKQISSEFSKRGGWTRSYLVTGGHLHTSTACSTCYPTTEFYFLPALSGSTETEIVEEAGERACTVCFPSAPVDVLKRSSALRTPSEKASDEERAAKAAKRAAADAEAITVEGLKEYRGRAHTFKSTRALSNFVAAQASSIAAWGLDHPTYPTWSADLDTAAEALSPITGATPAAIRTEALAKAGKRVAAERRKYAR